jgi:hypothetical protein
MRHCIFFYFLLIPNICGFCKHKVTFIASDSLRITADLYLNNYNYPFILLFHQNGYSRGEYAEIAGKLMNLGYNCLAVDLRSGGKVNYVKNALKNFNKPLFVYSSENEYSYILNMLDYTPDSILTIYRHKEGNGYHGAKVLWESNKVGKESWLELLMFFRKIK